jgi:hypothetical protein
MKYVNEGNFTMVLSEMAHFSINLLQAIGSMLNNQTMTGTSLLDKIPKPKQELINSIKSKLGDMKAYFEIINTVMNT